MSIVALRRVSLIGSRGDKEAVLSALQTLGVLHLIALGAGGEPDSDTPSPGAPHKALRYLLGCPVKRHQVPDDAGFDRQTIVHQTLENQRLSRDVEDSIEFVQSRLDDLKPWGDFEFPPLTELADHRLWFYEVPNYKRRQLAAVTLPWQEVHRDNRNSYIAVIARDEPPADAMPVPRTHTGSVPRPALRAELQSLNVRLDELAAEREALTRWIYRLYRDLARAEDAANLAQAQRITWDDDAVFAVQGWAPATVLPDIRALAKREGAVLLDEPVTPEAEPPTLLANDERTAGGEEVVRFYQMPGYRSWDPSRVIFFSFAVFFAMILADAGYALGLGAALLLAAPQLARSRSGRRLRNMGFALVACSLAYGVASGSYFGWMPPPQSWLGRLKLFDVNDSGQMMQFSVAVGLAHLIIANVIVAWQHRRRSAALAPLGWVVALIAATLIYFEVPGGGLALTLSLAAVAGFTDTRPIRRPLDLLWRVGGGLYGLTRSVKAFGDVLSYLRLFALGLATASLAVTFNRLAVEAAATVPEFGVLLFVLILVVGHALNFVLAVVSGVVHGLRLNVIEFYNWGISEEGYPFKPFMKTETGQWSN